MRKYWYLGGAALAVALATAAPGWWVKGHEGITEAAAAGLPKEVPAFFRAGGKALAHYAGDPDRWKNRTASHLKAAVFPDHFIDLEDFEGKELPADRWETGLLLTRLGHQPNR